jgi:hypothetical protein
MKKLLINTPQTVLPQLKLLQVQRMSFLMIKIQTATILMRSASYRIKSNWVKTKSRSVNGLGPRLIVSKEVVAVRSLEMKTFHSLVEDLKV